MNGLANLLGSMEFMISGGSNKFKTSTCIDLYFHANKKSIGNRRKCLNESHVSHVFLFIAHIFLSEFQPMLTTDSKFQQFFSTLKILFILELKPNHLKIQGEVWKMYGM